VRRGDSTRTLRIIGGSWRGRRLRFPPTPAIRPTPDRVRETLFNWLSGRLPGARCLDLFAGSGALGLEALSRGAAHVTFVECDAGAAREIDARVTEWGAGGRGRVVATDARRFLAGPAEAFDIVFLDPPFASSLLTDAVAGLEHAGWLSADALIYLERPAHSATLPLPASWEELRAKRAGEVGYHLYSRIARGSDVR
jgi:16S rRNA (guanine966-N2)-methyltransferase